MKLNGILVVLAVCWMQLAFGDDTCPYAYAPDGTQYDFSNVAYQLQQFTQNENGYYYSYNISLCGVNPYPCSYSSDSAGVCQYWGPSVENSKCYGRSNTRQVIGLNNGAGVQIVFQGGDVCGSCNPMGPRISVITLSCDPWAPTNKISWSNPAIASPGMPPVSYFNGTMYCNTNYRPVSAPYPSVPPTGWSSCQDIYAPDGSNYDLSELMGRDFSTVVYSDTTQSYSNITFSVCGGISGFCGDGACQSWRSSAVCQHYEPLDVEKCFGQYNLDTSMRGLNFGEGVVITYTDGDKCNSCTPRGPRQTVLRLTCDSYYFPSELYFIQASQDQQSSILYINATIGCTPASTPVSSPWSSPQPSWGPQPYWAPNSVGRPPHVTIQYVGYDPSCNGSDAYNVTVTRTWYCYPGCQKQGHKYVRTDCDDDIFLPRGGSWVEQINYGQSYFCDTPDSAIYTRSRTCTGTFDFSYQECDANTVYTYSCNSPYCNQCSLDGKTQTEYCYYGTLYRCVTDNEGKAHRNPLM